MKLMEIIAFLFIFGLVMNGLAVLKIASTSYSTSDVSSPQTAQSAMVTQISIVIVAGIAASIATWIAMSMIPTASGGVPMDRVFGYSLIAGLITTSLYGSVTTLWNIYSAIPPDLQLGVGVMLAIILMIISFLATVGFAEITLDKELL